MEYNKENFDKAIAEIEAEMKERKKRLISLYASENNPYKIGDVVTDHIGSIIIEKISPSLSFGHASFPCCNYFGTELKKDGTPRKDGSKRSVHQTNIIK